MESRIKIETLNTMASDGESADRVTFAEMKSSLLLIAGEHYARISDRYYERVRSSKELTTETKIRLTKNHIGRIHKLYVNNILTYAPGVWCEAKDDKELSNRKAAELHNAVWVDAKERFDFQDIMQSWCDDFVATAEVWTKCWFDPMAGELKGYEARISPEGVPMIDEMGQPVEDETKPVFTGELKFESVQGYNVFRSPFAKSFAESPWIMIRKMVASDILKKTFPGEEAAKMIQDSADKTFLVFDQSNGGYRQSDSKECLVRETYFRPGLEYPRGYYYIHTELGILAEGELPFGIWPLENEVFDRTQTTPRGRGIVKQLRPYQIEINRCASKIAEHQMTLGDDKLVMFNGSKLSAGGQVPGVRGLTVTGQAPTVIPGRSGNQFLEYMQSQIAEMYQVAMIAEDAEQDPTNGQLDPYALLFKSATQKKRFKRHIARFERFLVRACKLYLKLAKKYLPDDAVIRAIGKKEAINISEFKNSNDIDVEITLEPRTDDVETLMGKQLVMNHLLQYVGTQLSREDIGKIVKQMPYANIDESFSDLTMDYEIADNLLLALDRGEVPQVSSSEPNEYIVKKIDHRMLQADFKLLHPFIQQNYQRQKEERLSIIAEMKEVLARQQAGTIPMTGALIDAGAWVQDPSDPQKTKRLRMPQDAVYWLYQALQEQGYMQGELNKMRPELQAQMPLPQGPDMQGLPPQGNDYGQN